MLQSENYIVKLMLANSRPGVFSLIHDEAHFYFILLLSFAWLFKFFLPFFP